jgi:CDP-glucose 4,6-dehydratase
VVQRQGAMEGVDVNPSFWSGKRVFLTGHTGFKGSWMSLWMQSLGVDLTGYALQPPTEPSLFSEAQVGQGMRSIIGDIRDLDCLRTAMRESRPEIVLHMAAQPLVRYSYANPIETYGTNVLGTVHLLEAVRHTPGVKAVVNVTSDKCYENQDGVWSYRENDPMGGYDPYSSSKACAELVSSAYRSSFFNANTYADHGVALATARAGNVIGGGDWARDRLVPDILAALASGSAVNIRNPDAIRPWQHVLEPLNGYMTLAERLYIDGATYAESWNFGPNVEDAKPVSWIVEHLAKTCDDSFKWQVDTGAQPHEANYLKLDISKAHSRLGWRPALNLIAALQLVSDWNRQRRAGVDVRGLTMAQIDTYQNLTGN